MKKYIAKKNYCDQLIEGHIYELDLREGVYYVINTPLMVSILKLHDWFRPIFLYGK